MRASQITWVDVGCGYGELMEALYAVLPTDSRAVCIQPMTHKADAVRSRGLEFVNDYLQPQQFEAESISNMDVFSHIAAYRSFLKIVTTNLKSSGEIIVEIGNCADLETRDQVPNELGLPVFAGRTTMALYLASAGFEVRGVSEGRFDNVLQMKKNLIKLALGPPCYVAMPYRQPMFRTSRV
jgi:2-polyprenyl-3-methyl-5-hydroxy-6-metoxy-1,4-benzoquinol methylase